MIPSFAGIVKTAPRHSARRRRAMERRPYVDDCVLVSGRLDDGAAMKATAALLALDARGDRPIELHVDSPNGDLGAT